MSSPHPMLSDTRPRSDTLTSISSSSSSPDLIIQTPPTPSILAILSQSPVDTVDPHASPSGYPFTPLETPLSLDTSVDISPGTGKTKFGQAVRKKLERSKSSFKLLTLPRSSIAGTDTDEDVHTPDGRPESRKARFKSLISLSISRNASSISLRSALTTPGAPTSGLPVVTGTNTVHPDTPAGVYVRDFAPGSYFDDHSPSEIIQINDNRKGKQKGSFKRGLSTSIPTQSTIAQAIITRPRAASAPLILPQRRVSCFEEILPHEVKVYIMKILLGMWEESPRTTRWSGGPGGRRELVKLSRVSKSWQDLCFDGQLWSLVDLTPFASVLHTATLSRILDNTGPFIQNLSFRGHDALQGITICQEAFRRDMSSLTHLDLRGCKHIPSSDLLQMLDHSPHLRSINFKGLQTVTSEVLATAFRGCPNLESVDVSRCWDLCFTSIDTCIETMSAPQRQKLKELRIAGSKAYKEGGRHCLSQIAKHLVNLEVLDLGGCADLTDAAWQAWAQGLADAGMELSNLRHLIISGCTHLTISSLKILVGRVSYMTRFEMAGVQGMFKNLDRPLDGTHALNELLKSMPRIERLDLERTGMYGGIDDSTLMAVSPKLTVPISRDNPMAVLSAMNLASAKGITSEGLVRFLRASLSINHLILDDTEADRTVLREWNRRRASGTSFISLLDCRRITQSSYGEVAGSSRPRDGWSDYSANVFEYTEAEMRGTGKGVVKTFWGWKRVSAPAEWRVAREDTIPTPDDVAPEVGDERETTAMAGLGGRPEMGNRGRRGSWWSIDREDDDFHNRSCTIM